MDKTKILAQVLMGTIFTAAIFMAAQLGYEGLVTLFAVLLVLVVIG